VVRVKHNRDPDPLVSSLIQHLGREHPRLIVVLKSKTGTNPLRKSLVNPAHPLKSNSVLPVSSPYMDIDLGSGAAGKAHRVKNLRVSAKIPDRVLDYLGPRGRKHVVLAGMKRESLVCYSGGLSGKLKNFPDFRPVRKFLELILAMPRKQARGHPKYLNSVSGIPLENLEQILAVL